MAREGERGRHGTSAVTSAAKASALYEMYGERVYAFCLARLVNREEAADAVQDTFLKAWLALAKGDHIERPLPWLLTIAENVCVSRFRARRSRVTEAELADAGAMRAAQSDVAVDDIAAALRTLPANQRRAFLQRELQGYSYDEIGADLGVSRAAVTALLYRARRALANFLGEAARRAAPCFIPLPQLLRSVLQSGPSVSAATTSAAVLAIPQLAPLPPVANSSRPHTPSAPSHAANAARVLSVSTSVRAVRPVPSRRDISPSAPRAAATPWSIVVSPPSTTQDTGKTLTPPDKPSTPEPQGGGPAPASPHEEPERAPTPGSEPSDPPDEQGPSEQPGSDENDPPDADAPGEGSPPTAGHGDGHSKQPGSQGNAPPDGVTPGAGQPPQSSHGNGHPNQQGSHGNGPPDQADAQGNGPPSDTPHGDGSSEHPDEHGSGPPNQTNSGQSGPPGRSSEENGPPGSSGSGEDGPPHPRQSQGNGSSGGPKNGQGPNHPN